MHLSCQYGIWETEADHAIFWQVGRKYPLKNIRIACHNSIYLSLFVMFAWPT